MDLQKLEPWVTLCENYDVQFDKYLRPLLLSDVDDAIILGRKGFNVDAQESELFLASFSAGSLYYLGGEVYFNQCNESLREVITRS